MAAAHLQRVYSKGSATSIAYGVSKSLDFTKDFKIPGKISKDFKILVKISRDLDIQ